MTILLLIAGAFLGLSLLMLFGPQFAAYGRAGLRDALKRPEAKILGSGLATGMTVLLFAPLIASALISGGKTVQVVAATLMGLSFV